MKKIMHLIILLLLIPFIGMGQNCVDFESLTIGEEFGNGYNTQGDVIFTENGIPVTVEYFEWTGGGGTFGTCQVIDGTGSFGTGKAMWTNNVNLGFDFTGLGYTPNRVMFDFTDSGGNENISVNGSTIYAGELIGAPMPPGVAISMVNMGTYWHAILSGEILSLVVGGQEFSLDNICAILMEDPTDCVDFELLAPGSGFGNGINAVGEVIFTENDIPVTVEYFEWTGGGGTFGTCNVIDGTASFGTGQAMWTNNINLGFDFTNIGFSPNRVTFDFTDSGGNENISVNGEPIFAGELNMAPMPPGISMSIIDMGSYQRATLSGAILTLLIGGQEFAIDNICPFIAVDSNDCVDFDLLGIGTNYGNGINAIGDVIFTENDIPVSVEYFNWTGGGGTFGNAHVLDGNPVYGTGNAMWTSNINLQFDLSDLTYVTNWISFDYNDGGGNENFSINNMPIFVGELDELLLPPGFSMGITDMGDYMHFVITSEAVITKFLVGGQEFSIDNVCVGYILDPSDCIDFEYLAVGAEYGDGQNTIGEVFYTEGGIPLSVEYFEWTSGGTFGTCWVIDGDPTYGTGNAMWTSNVNLKVNLYDVYPASTQITFDFSDFGGSENLGVNGHPLFVGDLPNAVLPAGFSMNIVNMGAYEQATIISNEIITELVIGGQEFTIDNICPSFNISVEEPGNASGSKVELGLNYPNPFNGYTNIPFEVKEKTHLVITVYDYLGREVARLADADFDIGSHEVSWNASAASNGIYFYQLLSGGETQLRKMMLNK